MPNPLELIRNDTDKRENKYCAYREYYVGEHSTQLTDRQRRYLQLKVGEEFRANYCPIVVDALAERLHITGFDTGEGNDQDEIFWGWWKDNRMGHQQGIIHLSAVRDGDAYLMVSWDDEEGQPKFTFEPGWDGAEGVKCHYSQDKRGDILFASKRWKDDDSRDRLNLYFPDRIEKYVRNEGDAGGGEGWAEYQDEGEAWPIPWLGTDGLALGIPVIHFKNKDQGYNYGISELADIVPLQNALNKAIIDLVAAADTTAFRIFWMKGDDPSDIEITPGGWIFSEKPPDSVDLGYFPGEDLSRLIEFKDAFVMEVARVSRTPISYFQVSGHRPAEGTLKQEEMGLVAKARKRQVGMGNAWEDVMAVSRRLWNVYGDTESGEGHGVLDEEQDIETIWQDAQTRNEQAKMEELKLKREALRIPLETLWLEAGYSPEQIVEMQETDEYKAGEAQRAMLMEMAEGRPQQQPGQEPEREEE